MKLSKYPAPAGITVPDLCSENTFTLKTQPHCTRCGAVITGTVGRRILGTDFHCVIKKDRKPGKVFCYSCGQAASLCIEVIFCRSEDRLIPRVYADINGLAYEKSYWIGVVAAEAPQRTCLNHQRAKEKIESGEAKGYIVFQALEDQIISPEQFIESWPHCEDRLLDEVCDLGLISEEDKRQVLERLDQEMTTDALRRA